SNALCNPAESGKGTTRASVCWIALWVCVSVVVLGGSCMVIGAVLAGPSSTPSVSAVKTYPDWVTSVSASSPRPTTSPSLPASTSALTVLEYYISEAIGFTITIPATTCWATVDWEDGTTTQVTSCVDEISHTYSERGFYSISIQGQIESLLFDGDGSLISVKELCSGVTALSFQRCFYLTSVPSDMDVSLVSDMSHMFQNCVVLIDLDLSGWNTTSATDMTGMFDFCWRLQSLDLSNWNTTGVTHMGGMFEDCSALSSLDLTGWDTSSVVSMDDEDLGGMFQYCRSLTHLDISHWDTSSVTDMGTLFYECESLNNLDLSHWDTSNVSDMYMMFSGCEGLTDLDIAGWETDQADTRDMCDHCPGCDIM
ncbi:protein of unknown function DUF285, partial [Kipferlia bialata]